MCACVSAVDANLRWLVVMDPSSVEPLHDGSRLGGIVLSLRKPSNLCKQHTWAKTKKERKTHTNNDGNMYGQTDEKR